MEWSIVKNQLVSFLEQMMEKEKYTSKNVLATITILYSLLLISIGFISTVLNVYIGDELLRILLLVMSLLLLVIMIIMGLMLKKLMRNLWSMICNLQVIIK